MWGYTALYPHRFCYASVGWARGLTLPRAFSTAECTGAARGIRAARRSGRAGGCGAGARLVASDAAEGSAWCSRPCKAGGGRAAEVTSRPCAGPHVSRRCWSASTSRAGSGSSCSSLATAPRRRPLASAGSKRHDDGRAGSGERGRRRRRIRNQGVAGSGCEMRWSCGVGGARRGRRSSPVCCRARPDRQCSTCEGGEQRLCSTRPERS